MKKDCKKSKNMKYAFSLVDLIITLLLIGVISVCSLNIIDRQVKKEKDKKQKMSQMVHLIAREIFEEMKWKELCGSSTVSCNTLNQAFDMKKYIYLIENSSGSYFLPIQEGNKLYTPTNVTGSASNLGSTSSSPGSVMYYFTANGWQSVGSPSINGCGSPSAASLPGVQTQYVSMTSTNGATRIMRQKITYDD